MSGRSRSDVGVVVATHDRCDALLSTLGRLAALPEAPPIVVVDNGSTDGTVEAVRALHPEVRVIGLSGNLGAAARTVGVEALETPLVAFCDDDSWWAPGALDRAAGLFEAHPRLALLAARILVGPDERVDPACLRMSEGPLPQEPDLPGRSVLGFLACGAIVRRSALLSIGGFPSRFGIGGEEEVVALDLAAAGWGLAYVDAVVAHHHPARTGCSSSRRRREIRNELWTAWTRRRLPGALFKTARLANTALRSGQPAALLDAARGLPWALRERRPVPRSVERAARSLERRPSRRPKSPAVLREPSANLGGSKAS